METVKKIQDHLMNPDRLKTVREYTFLDCAPRITCEDGFSISVQASRTAYCAPREDRGPWYTVELGFPTSSDELIQEYAESPEEPTETVYGYVPIEIVAALLDKHGGIK